MDRMSVEPKALRRVQLRPLRSLQSVVAPSKVEVFPRWGRTGKGDIANAQHWLRAVLEWMESRTESSGTEVELSLSDRTENLFIAMAVDLSGIEDSAPRSSLGPGRFGEERSYCFALSQG